MPADQKTIRVKYLLTAERQEVHIPDGFTGGVDVTFRRGEVKELPDVVWVRRLLRQLDGFDQAAREACEFVETTEAVGLDANDPKRPPLPEVATPTAKGDAPVPSEASPAGVN